MPVQTILGAYAREALNQATIEPTEDGGFVGRVPGLPRVIAFGNTERDCIVELFSVIED